MKKKSLEIAEAPKNGRIDARGVLYTIMMQIKQPNQQTISFGDRFEILTNGICRVPFTVYPYEIHIYQMLMVVLKGEKCRFSFGCALNVEENICRNHKSNEITCVGI